MKNKLALYCIKFTLILICLSGSYRSFSQNNGCPDQYYKLIVDSECEALVPDFTGLIEGLDAFDSIFQVPHPGSLATPYQWVSLTGRTENIDSTICSFRISLVDTSLALTYLGKDTLWADTLGRLLVPDLRKEIEVTTCNYAIHQYPFPGSYLSLTNEISFSIYITAHDYGVFFSDELVIAVADSLNLPLIMCSDTSFLVNGEGAVGTSWSEITGEDLSQLSRIDISRIQNDTELFSLTTNEIDSIVNLNMCDLIGDTLNVKLTDHQGKFCNSRVQVLYEEGFEKKGNAYNVWCPLIIGGSRAEFESFWNAYGFPEAEFPCGNVIELNEAGAAFAIEPCENSEINRFAVITYNLSHLAANARYSDTIFDYKIPPIDSTIIFCPQIDSLSDFVDKGFGPALLLSEDPVSISRDIDRDGTNLDTIYFLKIEDIDGNGFLNLREEIQLSAQLRFFQDCNLEINLDVGEVKSYECYSEVELTFELEQLCIGNASSVQFTNVDQAENALVQIGENKWRCNFKLLFYPSINRPINCNQTIFGMDQPKGFFKGNRENLGDETTGPGRDVFGRVIPQSNIKLFQNRPNPISDNTMIEFYLPHSINTHLVVYDTGGRVLFQKREKSRQGFNQLELLDTHLVESGVFFYTLEAGGFRETKRMIKLPN